MKGVVQYKQIGIIQYRIQKSPSKNGSRKPHFECRLCGRETQNTKDNF